MIVVAVSLHSLNALLHKPVGVLCYLLLVLALLMMSPDSEPKNNHSLINGDKSDNGRWS